ncbi:MAG: ABC transporter permease subunit [Chitinivibrionales bacterium]|nr:ABC transporter permease subunit [Chitinivibrionales bacterium]
MATAKKIPISRIPLYWYLYLLIIPSVILVAVFSYFPAVSGIYHSFFRWNGDYIKEFVAFRNYAEAFRDPILGRGFIIIFVLVTANVVKMIPSVITAVVINRLKSDQSAYIYKVLFVVPMIIPWMVYLLVWKFFYDPNTGLLNAVLNGTGMMDVLQWIDGIFDWGVFIEGSNPVWLGNEKLVVPALIIWGFPWVGVVGVLIYLAGLQAIDKSVYEAAEIDGIGWLGKFWYIEFPLIMTQVRINIVMLVISTLKSYGLMLVLFGVEGGPNGIALVPGLYMYVNAFAYQRVGYACAIGILLFFFILILTEFNNRFVRVDK